MLRRLLVSYFWLIYFFVAVAGEDIEEKILIPESKHPKIEAGKPPQSINVRLNSSDFNVTKFHKEFKIMGGQETNHHRREAPSVVSIMVFDGKEFSHKCAGSICSDDRVLTSAYCVHEVPTWHILILSGTDCLNADDDRASISRVKEITIHEKYNFDRSEYDIAILKVIGKFNFNCFNPPTRFPLPIGLSFIPVGSICHVYGWGYVKEPSEYSEATAEYFTKCMRKISVEIIDHEICRKAFIGIFNSIVSEDSPVTDHQVCAAGNLLLGGQDACYGDEGTPLICHTSRGPVLYGIASYGFGCGRPNYPGVYTSAFQLLPWISKNGCPLCEHYDNDALARKSSVHSPKISTQDENIPVKNEL